MTTSLSEDGPAGTYVAIILMSTTGTTTTNHGSAGETFRISLLTNGTTRGRLQLVAAGGNPSVDADLEGTWARSGDTIDLTIPAGTFANEMLFTIEQVTDRVWYLVGDQIISGTRYNVRLAHDN